jgi:hypothetical protein
MESSGSAFIQSRDAVAIARFNALDVGGKNEVATMSAMFSNSDDWENVKGEGWRLVSLNTTEAHQLPGLKSGETYALPGAEGPAVQVPLINQANGAVPVVPTGYGGVNGASVASPVTKGLSAEGPQIRKEGQWP